MHAAVEIEHIRDHEYDGPPRGRCAQCGKGKPDMAHVGVPFSLNVFASSRSEFVYLRAKQAWQDLFVGLLAAADFPTCRRVVVEGELCFPDRRRRDQGNYRFILEKALGDALTEGGWLEDDDWTRYEFGGLAYRYEKGEAWTRLVLFPSDRNLTIVGHAA